MTAFVLVSGPFTGGWVWDGTAAALREAGAEAYPVTLAGMEDSRDVDGSGGRAGSGIDLERHIQDVIRVIDEVAAPTVVLVGHCYGIHPVLGAADRRAERVARVVYLDAGMPQDGDLPLQLVPDQAIREELRRQIERPTGESAEESAGEPEGEMAEASAGESAGTRVGSGPARPSAVVGGGRGIAPPASVAEWERWGSAAGVPAAAWEELTRRAVPQPLGTLVQPLRLTGAGSAAPLTGVFCTANGASIAVVEALAGMGDPRLRALADPRVTFFDLATGHWPMLSVPAELADVLTRAAAGEGHRLTAGDGELPPHLRPFLLDVPEQRRERVDQADFHLPEAEGPRPAVVFVHGGPVPAGAQPTPRDWPVYVGYAQYVASAGAVGVTFDHRLHDLGDFDRAAADVAEVVERVRADPRVDGDRIALWFVSGGGLLSAPWLAAPPPWLRCVSATYPILAPLRSWGLTDSRFRPAEAIDGAQRVPIVLVRAGRERAEIAVTVEEFLAAAERCEADVEIIDVPQGEHGFETIDHSEEARGAVQRAVRAVLGHLDG